ncbi:uracil-DNA glycosylase [Vagococcus fluvialis]|uniref:Uracil-DNA glycosylase n=1 Tax=Vagococcus fluvialis TaxID=2738 RepID=A0A7X6D747_9ENTE|nr:uracil-DNA glycosylase [Vagococcus fluvialis]NKC67050.1 uracil-DNA glycosylase [Vagococcus fluvialis]
MRLQLPNNWEKHLADEIKQDYFKELELFLDEEYKNQIIFPKEEDIFTALEATSFEETQVVILGQDPYHGENQAHGLSFSVLPGEKLPPSLRNIYQELESDVSVTRTDGYLLPWATQGILLLNTVLTVRKGRAHSHKNKGWEKLTDAIIKKLNLRESPVIFVLWGKPAQSKKAMIDTEKHYIIEAPHPSPLSAYRGFFGSQPFSVINKLLTEQSKKNINWG